MITKKIIVHKFRMADVEDPYLYAASPLYEWEISEPGQFIMKHAIEEPVYNIVPNVDWLGHECVVTAILKEKDILYWKLKYE